MQQSFPSPGMPNPADAVRAVRMVQAVARPAQGIALAVSQLLAMPRDARYRLSAVCRVGIPAIIAVSVLNYIFWNFLFAIPLVATVVERVVLIGLAMTAYAILSRELIRYRAVLDYVAQYGLSAP